MTSDALWVVSEFAIPDTRYGRFIARPIIAVLYLAFGCLTGLTIRELPAHREALQRAGFILTRQRKRVWGLLVSELWQFGPPAQTSRPQINAEPSAACTAPL
jgi:hypothetical protein